MMKYLYIAPRFHTNQYALTKYLIEMGNEVNFIVARKAQTEDYTYIIPILCKPAFMYKIIEKLKFSSNSNAKEDFRIAHFIPSIFFLLKEISRLSPDIIIVRDRSYLSMVSIWAAKLLRKKCVILYTQSPLYRKPRSIKNRFFVGLYNTIAPYDALMTPVEVRNSDEDKNSLIVEKKSFFVPFVSDIIEEATSRNYFKDNKINIIDVGKYRPYKNHYVLIKALTFLPENVLEQIRVTIVGQSVSREEVEYYNELQAEIIKSGLQHIVSLKTNIPFSEMKKEYLANDIFILTSKVEQCSVAVIEAMSYGLFTISTNNNGTASYIKNSFGRTFKTDNYHDLASVLNEVCRNKEVLRQGAKKAIEVFKSDFVASIYESKLMKIYNEVISNP